MEKQDIQQTLGHLFRHEAGKMAAVLTRLFGLPHLQAAEDIVQETLLQALNTWKFQGIPDNPTAWLYAVAKNKALDMIRREKRIRHHHTNMLLESEWTLTPAVQNLFLDTEIEDSQLRMIFACCHPAIPEEAQIILILKTLCGLSVHEIAAGLLTTDDTVAKRLYRAREKLREEAIELAVPQGHELTARLQVVWKSLYLLFNEGYLSAQTNSLIRQDLCEEALRLALLLSRHPVTNTPTTSALIALMCFQASRFDTRMHADGSIILLHDQDRSQWNHALILRGQQYLNQAASGDEISEYHLEAAIASCHALAPSLEATNWEKIIMLYDMLAQTKPGMIVQLNRAIAIGYHNGATAGIHALLEIRDADHNQYYHTALGDFYAQLHDNTRARTCYEHALTITESKHEQELLFRKLAALVD